MKVLTPSQATQVFDLLVELKQLRPDDRYSFVPAYAEGKATEWRLLSGTLAFGGKFWFNPRRGRSPIYVSCYPEDLNPERELTIRAINEELEALYRSWTESAS